MFWGTKNDRILQGNRHSYGITPRYANVSNQIKHKEIKRWIRDPVIRNSAAGILKKNQLIQKRIM